MINEGTQLAFPDISELDNEKIREIENDDYLYNIPFMTRYDSQYHIRFKDE